MAVVVYFFVSWHTQLANIDHTGDDVEALEFFGSETKDDLQMNHLLRHKG